MDNRKRTLASLELDARALRRCGLVFLAAGCIGSLIQRQVLGLGSVSTAELFALISELPHGMAYATVSVVCQVLELCAVPVFAFLLTEGAKHTAHFWNYLLRVLGLALVSEIPYNLLTAGVPLDLGTRNPVFGAAATLLMLYFFRTYREKRIQHRLIRATAVLGAFLWCNFLGVVCGSACAVIAAALWVSDGKQNRQLLIGAAASIACSVLSPLYLFTPFSFLFIHLYNGDRAPQERRLYYLTYPLMLIAFFLITLFMQ